ncbi:MAG: Hsp20/alpha crystallin family protein [Candidatus Taylorbacteria bacterium]|nr:Hsp20/alpha crystallin family protein [Candidatus Taylorbacteria bacterium]
MSKEKKSFFDRLTGTVNIKDEKMILEEEESEGADEPVTDKLSSKHTPTADLSWEDEQDAELAIDMYQTADSVIIKAFIAGVSSDDLDVNITRELVTIKGVRKPEKMVHDEDSFASELFWGSFSRTVTLPLEIDVEEADAVQKLGLLTITMPKLDKKRQMKLKVKSNGN